MNLANQTALKIMHISRAIKRGLKAEFKAEPVTMPKVDTPKPVAQPMQPVQAEIPSPPLGESGLDVPTVLNGGSPFDALLGGMRND